MRQKPGIGTVSNVFVLGIVVDITLSVLGDVHGFGYQLALLMTGVLLNAVAWARAYIVSASEITRTDTPSATLVAGLRAMTPRTSTRPPAMSSTACSRDRARPRRTNSASSRVRRGTVQTPSMSLNALCSPE